MGESGKRRRVLICVLMMTAAFIFTPVSHAATVEDLLKRIEALEQQNKELKSELESIKSELGTVRDRTVSPVPAAGEDKNKAVLSSTIPLDIYGYIRVDTVYDDSSGDTLITNAPRESGSKDDNEFNMTANDTRIGLKLTGVDLSDGGVLTGKIEADFWNGDESTAGNTPQLRLRLAYAKIAYPRWDVAAGQMWDFFSPLGPSTLNAGYGWRAGNLGHRHPSIVAAVHRDDVLGGTLTAQLGAIDTNDDAQEKRGFPVSGMRVSLAREILGRPVTLGLAGIYGQIEQASPYPHLPIWAATGDLRFELTDKLSFKGEAFMGQKLEDFRGGSSIGVVHNKAVRSNGGFVQLSYKITDRLESNAGYGMDNVTTEWVSGDDTSLWDTNQMIFSNLKYSLSKNLLVGLEYQHFATKYGDGVKGDTDRIQSTMFYKF